MTVNEDLEFRKLIEQEKEKISADLGDFVKFLAYTREDGPDDVEEEPERRGIRRLKGTPVWAVLYPARKTYRAMKFLYENGPSGVYHKAQNAVANNRLARRKEARKFLTKIMPTEEEKKKQREREFDREIKISVLVPLFNTPEKFLRDMIGSVREQTYRNWELCLADASDADAGNVARIVKEYAAVDPRIRYEKLKKNMGIAENTNACIRMASGNYLALFDHDDMLHPSALYECVKTIASKGADFVYTDEVTFEGTELENIITYHFKPDFSVDNLRGVNYICHLSVFSKSLLDQVGLFRPEYDGSQDHDMIMRLTDAADCICHIPKVLYFWRYHKMSTSMNLNAKSYAVSAGIRAVRDAEARRGYPAKVYSAQICKTHYRMKYEISNPRISVIIDGSGRQMQKAARTAASLEKLSSYGNYGVYCAMTQAKLTEAFRQADGEYVLLLAAGSVILTPAFIEELLMFAQRQDVGLVGAQVLDEKNLIVSSDLVVGKTPDTIAVEMNRGERYDAPGYMGRNYYAHNISAVSGCACMARTKEFGTLWEKSGEKTTLGKILSVCFALRAEGRQIVLNPYALCRIANADYRQEISAVDRQNLMHAYAKEIAAGDPFYNKNLSLERHWHKK